MSDKKLKKAKFVRETPPTEELEVHFNPESLQYQVSNTLDKGKGDKKKQYVSQSSGKLTMEVVFDTTHVGKDVRAYTQKLAGFMEPGKDKIPAVVRFEWGVYTFKGMLEAFKETIEFFDPQGVPLRSTVNLTLAKQDKVFEDSATAQPADTKASQTLEPVEVPPSSKGATDAAAKGGSPGAARSIAAFNGEESLRFSAGASLTVSGSVELTGPVAFASGGAGIGGGAGLGVGGGLGIGGAAGISGGIGGGAGISGGISGGAGISAGAGATFGGGASAGVTASGGAFAGLRPPASGSRSLQKLNVDRLTERTGELTAGADSRADFALGGKASLAGSASLKADVGANARLSSRIRFDED